MSSPRFRIYLVGAHATGKTTLARWIRDRYGIAMISEVARGVLAEMEAQLARLRSDIDCVDRYQQAVFERQIAIEAEQRGSFVSDRAFCNLAYAAQHATILSNVFRDPRLARYMDSVRAGLVFFLRPHRTLLADDGVRENSDYDEVLRIDGMVKLMLEMFDVPYIPVASLAMQERIRLIERTLDLAGLQVPDATDDVERRSSVTLVEGDEPEKLIPRPNRGGRRDLDRGEAQFRDPEREARPLERAPHEPTSQERTGSGLRA